MRYYEKIGHWEQDGVAPASVNINNLVLEPMTNDGMTPEGKITIIEKISSLDA